MQVEPQKQHRWLEQLVGEWSFESECVMGPDQPPITTSGTESVQSLGGLWAMCSGRSRMTGTDGEMYSRMTLGYDPATGKFVGTFVASCMTHLWVYDGKIDAAEKVLTLDTEGPSFTDPAATAKYQDIIEMRSPDDRVLRSQFQTADGKWHQFMTAHYRRVG